MNHDIAKNRQDGWVKSSFMDSWIGIWANQMMSIYRLHMYNNIQLLHDLISSWEYQYWRRLSRIQFWYSQVDIISWPMPQLYLIKFKKKKKKKKKKSLQLFYYVISLNKNKATKTTKSWLWTMSWTVLNFFFYMMTNWFHSVKRGMNAYYRKDPS